MNVMGQNHVFMAGDDCYVLRCSMLHQGLTDVGHQKAKGVLDKFYFTTLQMHLIQVGTVIHLNVKMFCEEIIAAVRKWVVDFHNNHQDKVGRLAQLIHIHSQDYSVGGVSFAGAPT